MKRHISTLLTLAVACTISAQLRMGDWKLHLAYNNITRLEQSSSMVYGLSGGSLFGLDKEDHEIVYFNKMTGLSSSDISQIRYVKKYNYLIVVYSDGNIDLIYDSGNIKNIADLYTTFLTVSKSPNSIYIHGDKAYLSMKFGILTFDLKRLQFGDTYYIGHNSKEVDVISTAQIKDTLYAISKDTLYKVSTKDNMMDFVNWKRHTDLPSKGELRQIASLNDQLILLRDTTLYKLTDNGWEQLLEENVKVNGIHSEEDYITILTPQTNIFYSKDKVVDIPLFIGAEDMIFDTYKLEYWFAAQDQGLCWYNTNKNVYDEYLPNGPIVNSPYKLKFFNDRLYMVQGFRDATQYFKEGVVMIYEDGEWKNIPNYKPNELAGFYVFDFVDIAQDPNNSNRFFAASYGCGLFEFVDNEPYKLYTIHNSPLKSMLDSPADVWQRYTRVDGLSYDEYGNLWMVNSPSYACILTPDTSWVSFPLKHNNAAFYMNTPGQWLFDKERKGYRWLYSNRAPAGLFLLDDNGTPLNPKDDHSIFRSDFYINNSTFSPTLVTCTTQDMNNDIWIGTNNGVIIIDYKTDFFSSNAARRPYIRRNDGTNFVDNLLEGESVNCIAVDGSNRKWIGTSNSGLYLVNAEGSEVIQHFTTENSPLISNNIRTLAIHERTGELFIGTANGLMSYQSDAAEAHDNLNDIYVYPNPVRPDFDGIITIAGLMENSTVKITDAAGQLVIITRSNGGIATWDGLTADGKQAASGVYLVQAVSEDASKTAITKFMIIR